MLVALATASLKIQKDARHENQNTALGMLKDVFASEVSRWEARVAEANSAVAKANEARMEKMGSKDAADAEVRSQKDVVKANMDAQARAMEVVEECVDEQQKALALRQGAEASKQDLHKEQEHDLAVQETLKALKEGSCENPKELKKHISAISALFNRLGAEEALVKALPQVLVRKPAERGSFDEIALQQLDSNFEKHLRGLQSKIDFAGVDVDEHVVAVTAWEAALEVAEDKKRDCDEALRQAQAQQVELDGALNSARKVLKEHTAAVKTQSSELTTEQIGHQKIEEVCTALEFLHEYVEPVETEEMAVESAAVEMAVESAAVEMAVEEIVEPTEVTIPNKAKEMDVDMPDMPSPSKAARHTVGIPMVVA